MNKLSLVGRVPPSSQEIEEVVLGAALLEKEGCKILCELLIPAVFYNGHHATIFASIKTLHDSKVPVDILTLTQEMTRIGEIKNVGGAYKISQLTNKVASAENIETHCRILLQFYFKREIIRISSELIKEGYDDFSDSFDLIDKAKKELKNIESLLSTNKIADNNQIIDTVLSNIEEAATKGGITGLSTGMKNLDYAIMGLRKKFKYLISAQAGEGKTSIAKSIAVHLSHRLGIPGVFFTLEVTEDMFMTGCLSEILQIPNQKIQTGQLTDFEKHEIKCVKDSLFTKSLIIDDRGGLSPNDIRSTLRKLKESHKIEWFVVDYINLQQLKGNDNKNKSKEEKVAEIVNENKNMAKEFDLVCIELSQLTKEISRREGGRPQIGDLKDSSALEQSADVVILVYRPENHGLTEYNGQDTMGLAELIIAKNKWGPKKNIVAKYKAEFTQFLDHEEGREFVPTPF